jgi:hypothetical protein
MSLAHSWLLHNCFPLEYAATRALRTISHKAARHGNDDLLSFVMLPDAPPVSRLPPLLYSSAMRCCDSGISLFLAEGGCEHRVVRPAHAPSPSACARCAAAGARAGGMQDGAKDLAAGAPGTAGRGIPAVQAAGALSPSDLGVLIVRRGRRGRKRRGAAPLRGGSLRPPHQEPRRWQRSKRLGRARHQAVYKRGAARRGGIWERGSGDAGRHHSACRPLKEEEAGLLHFEVSNRPSGGPGFGAGV